MSYHPDTYHSPMFIPNATVMGLGADPNNAANLGVVESAVSGFSTEVGAGFGRVMVIATVFALGYYLYKTEVKNK